MMKKLQIKHLLITCLFLGFLYLHFFDFIFHMDATELTENRFLAGIPENPDDFKSAIEYPKAFEAYYQDNFGFRKLLVSAYNLMITRFPGTSPTGITLTGKDGWFFSNNLEFLRRTAIISDKKLERIKTNLHKRITELKKRNMKLLYVIAPHKASVYPEYLPDNLNILRNKTTTDYIVDYLKDDPQIDILDLRERFTAEDDRRDLYYPADLHWFDKGALLATNTIAEHLRNQGINIKPIDAGELVSHRETVAWGEWTSSLGIQKFYPYNRQFINLKNPRYSVKRIQQIRRNREGLVETENADSSLPSALVYCDSFGAQVQKYLPDIFSTVTFTRNVFNMRRARVVGADVVIILQMEINLDGELSKAFHEHDNFVWNRFGVEVNYGVPAYANWLSFDVRTNEAPKSSDFLIAEIEGDQVGEWEISEIKQSIKLDISNIARHDGEKLNLRLRLERPHERGGMLNGHLLRFDVILRSAGDQKKNVTVRLNEEFTETAPGYNLLHVSETGKILGISNFDTESNPEANTALIAKLESLANENGYLLLLTEGNAGKQLNRAAVKAIRSLGSKANVRGKRFMGHVLVYYLTDKKLVHEEFGINKSEINIGSEDNRTRMIVTNFDCDI